MPSGGSRSVVGALGTRQEDTSVQEERQRENGSKLCVIVVGRWNNDNILPKLNK